MTDGVADKTKADAPHSGPVARMRDALDPEVMAIGLVVTFALLIDAVHPVQRDYLVEPSWTLAVYGLVPFSLAVVLESRRSKVTVGRIAGFAGVAATLAVIAARSWILPKNWLETRPAILIGWVTGALVLSAAGAVLCKANLGRWGVALGDWRWWLPRFGVLMALIVPMIVVGAILSPDLLDYYPEYKPARTNATILFYYQLGNGIYMLGWEYFFRGFLTFSIAKRSNASVAAILQAIPFLLLHAAKVELEMVASYVGSVLLAAWCLRARTFLPSVLLHWGMNLTMEIAGYLY